MKTQSTTPSPHYFEAFNICSGPQPFLSLWWFTLPYRKGSWHIFETLDYLYFPNLSLQAPVRPLSGKITFTLHIPAYHHKFVFSISSTTSGISLFLPGCHPTYSSSSTEELLLFLLRKKNLSLFCGFRVAPPLSFFQGIPKSFQLQLCQLHHIIKRQEGQNVSSCVRWRQSAKILFDNRYHLM